MAIQIVDNFQVNIAQSIDNRLVVGPSQFYTDKDDLPYKYAGMRVWDLNSGGSGVPYVWTGTTFSTEASSGIAGSGTNGFIPKFIGGGNVLDDSIIKEVGVNIGIGTITPDKKLTVAGDIKSTGAGGFYGKGSNITDINADNITSGTLLLTRLENGTVNLSPYNGDILQAGGGSPVWTNPSTITVGNSTNTTNIAHSVDTSSSARRLLFINTTSSSGNHGVKTSANYTFQPNSNYLYLNGYMGIGTGASTAQRLRVGGKAYITDSLGVKTSPNASYAIQTLGDIRLIGGSVLVENGTESSPSLSFYGDRNTGIYRTGLSDSLGFTTGGKLKFRIRQGSATDFEFWNYNGSGGLNGALINYGNRLLVSGFSWFETPKLAVGGQIGSKLDVIDNTSSNYVARIYNDAGSASGGGGLYIRTNNNSPSNNLLICQRSPGSNVFRVTGNGNSYIGAGTLVTSDRRNKENIKPTEGSLDKLMQLNPVTFKWIDREESDFNYGFISQEVKEIYPDIVLIDDGYEDEDNYRLVLNYQALISELVKSTQEQQEIIKGLEKRIKDLES